MIAIAASFPALIPRCSKDVVLLLMSLVLSSAALETKVWCIEEEIEMVKSYS